MVWQCFHKGNLEQELHSYPLLLDLSVVQNLREVLLRQRQYKRSVLTNHGVGVRVLLLEETFRAEGGDGFVDLHRFEFLFSVIVVYVEGLQLEIV